MFLYWKKRGAYELETIPTSLTELGYSAVERFSWSSSLDIIEDLAGKPHNSLGLGASSQCQTNTFQKWKLECIHEDALNNY
ncbi:hypothetical protein XELAEV_18037599mg [Xenopus laevis]|uniref:Uncharacterized protein n=1 Tax=Xenopus laevis TaxID=8355 RepID=A0A974CCX4_XENLA|nr:hypothetical protein XELAEV_18037599mg [Xenopus laevis]